MCTRRELVHEARENFFAGAAFPEHKHRDVDVGDQRSLRADLAHRGAGGHEEYVVAQFFDFTRVRLLILAETLIDDGVEFCLLKGLGEVILRAQAHGLDDLAGIAHAREHDDFHARLHLAQLLECLQAVDAGHEHVEQHHVGLEALLHALQRFFAGGGGFHFVVVYFE